jgi:hypothetical protein
MRRLFCRDVYTDFITWLQFERPDELSIMIHTLTDQLVSPSSDQLVARMSAASACICVSGHQHGSHGVDTLHSP